VTRVAAVPGSDSPPRPAAAAAASVGLADVGASVNELGLLVLAFVLVRRRRAGERFELGIVTRHFLPGVLIFGRVFAMASIHSH